MKLNKNLNFKSGLYDVERFFRKYHNGLMFEQDFTESEVIRDINDLIKSVEVILKSISED